MGWTQPLCMKCWKLTHPDRVPLCVRDDDIVQCCLCGENTSAGIYTRLDPKTVAFPYKDD